MSHLHEELDNLKRELLTMGALVEEAVRKATICLTERKTDLVDEILSGDKRIDALENTIDRTAYNILALQQPVANDLRLVLMAMMANNELERIGDHAKNIAKASRATADLPPLPLFDKLGEASDQTVDMLSTSLDALINKDADTARTLRDRDDIVDNLCRELHDELVALMQDTSSLVPQCVHALRAVQNLERIADLANNIAKDLVYFLEGEIIRHDGRYEDADRAQSL